MERHGWHKLSDILVIAVCAVLCGAESYPAIEDFGHEREEWLRQFLELPAGIPFHDTFNRVLRVLDPVEFQSCFLSWMQAVAEVTQGEVVAIDGKALRRSFAKGTGKRAIHMVSRCEHGGEFRHAYLADPDGYVVEIQYEGSADCQ
jgi:DDE_Tnp_1-associated